MLLSKKYQRKNSCSLIFQFLGYIKKQWVLSVILIIKILLSLSGCSLKAIYHLRSECKKEKQKKEKRKKKFSNHLYTVLKSCGIPAELMAIATTDSVVWRSIYCQAIIAFETEPDLSVPGGGDINTGTCSPNR